MELIHRSGLNFFRLNEHRTIHLHSIRFNIYLLFVVHSNIEIILRRSQRTKINPSEKRTSVCHTGNRLTELKWKLGQTNWSCCVMQKLLSHEKRMACVRRKHFHSIHFLFWIFVGSIEFQSPNFVTALHGTFHWISKTNRSMWRNDVGVSNK